MKKMKKIVIYDDNEQWAKELKESLEALPVLEEFEVSALKENAFKEAMGILEERRRQVRKNGQWSADSKSLLDEIDIFIIDYDLLDTNAFLTGEDVAYSARCFSTCGLIVALNQYYEVDFDLTLKGHLESFADLNIRGEHLSNPNLWGGDDWEFRPWYWPVLPWFAQDFDSRVNDAKENLNLNRSICESLAFNPEPFDLLPRSISQFIGSEPAQTTFAQFVKSSGNGLRHQDSQKANAEILARVGAARISKWLERAVLPEMNILVDAPHMISRYPSLMTGDKEDIETWNKTTQLTTHTDLGLDTDTIEPFRFKKEFWLSRPAWFWDGVRECNEILEVREPWETFQPDWVFCEDVSSFHERDHTEEFVAEVESPFARRFVKYLRNDIKYQPRVRFSL